MYGVNTGTTGLSLFIIFPRFLFSVEFYLRVTVIPCFFQAGVHYTHAHTIRLSRQFIKTITVKNLNGLMVFERSLSLLLTTLEITQQARPILRVMIMQ